MKEEDRQSILNDLAIGGLLHDVGKLVQRATRERRNHMDVGGDWLKDLGLPWSEYAWAALFHHTNPGAAVTLEKLSDPEKALKAAIISHADNLSASEREDITNKWNADVQLKNIFDIVNLDRCEKKNSPNTFFPIAPLDDNGLIMPKPKDSRSKEFNYGSLEEGLRNHLKGSSGGPGWLLRGLERYTSFVPSDTAIGEERMPDISLFDHLRTTAMIAVCIGGFLMEKSPYLFNETDPMKCFKAIEKTLKSSDIEPFLMVEGDIRGIQKYIYDISGKKALRGLRARSFYLEAVLESTLCDLLEELGVPRTQVLFVGGGHWILLLPNTESTISKLEEFKQSLNRKLYSIEDGKLSLSLAWIPFGWDSLAKRTINIVFKKIAAELASERCHPMEGLLGEVLGNQNDAHFGKSCTVCGRRVNVLKSLDPEDAEGSACEHCKSLVDLAKDISDPDVRYLYSCPKGKRESVKILGEPYSTAKFPSDIPKDAKRVFVIKKTHDDIDKEDERFIPLPWAGYAWDNEIEKVLEDGCIGARKLGALRMDVDNLGRIFAEGLPKNLYSLSRVATMSRLLTHFFKVYIPIIAQRPQKRFVKEAFVNSQNKGRRLIVVYSGGDDLYVVGAWNEVAEFAIDVVEHFREFTGDNPSVTISGGMVMADDTAPIYSLAEIAGAAEESAKGHKCQGVQKDSLALFFSEDLEARGVFDKKFNIRKELCKLIEELDSFLGAVRLKQNSRSVNLDVDRAFLRKIMALHEMEIQSQPMWKAHVAYAAGRSKRGAVDGKVFSKMISAQGNTLKIMNVCAEWLDYLIR